MEWLSKIAGSGQLLLVYQVFDFDVQIKRKHALIKSSQAHTSDILLSGTAEVLIALLTTDTKENSTMTKKKKE